MKKIKVSNEECASMQYLVILVALQEKQLQRDGMWTGLPFWKHIQSLNHKALEAMDEDYDIGKVLEGEWKVDISEEELL